MNMLLEHLHERAVCADTPPAARRLYIDLDVCASAGCGECTVECSYLYHPSNRGVRRISELATYHLVCRRCEAPHCVAACPTDALEQQLDKGKLLVRHSMRCVSCHSCSHACPYGTIYPEYVPLLAQACDFCLDRREEVQEPMCVRTCVHGALRLAPPDQDEDDQTAFVGDYLVVHATHWRRD